MQGQGWWRQRTVQAWLCWLPSARVQGGSHQRSGSSCKQGTPAAPLFISPGSSGSRMAVGPLSRADVARSCATCSAVCTACSSPSGSCAGGEPSRTACRPRREGQRRFEGHGGQCADAQAAPEAGRLNKRQRRRPWRRERRRSTGGPHLPFAAALEDCQSIQRLLDRLHACRALGVAGEAVAWGGLYRVH